MIKLNHNIYAAFINKEVCLVTVIFFQRYAV